jgi:hypothetical protein
LGGISIAKPQSPNPIPYSRQTSLGIELKIMPFVKI